ncbi:MAG TPA: conjugal transfer protein TraD [Ginsengibacter sp.]|nr:conjugal transfer protein TraD [Ginsengibacter sp.]HRP43547.1 conjugal transfer protein TraD [Ginsengibacter sp.]
METVIVICLLLVIILLLEDKIVIYKQEQKQNNPEKKTHDLPDIMGLPKPVERHSMPKDTINSQSNKSEDTAGSFESETGKTGFENQIPQEELDEVFGSVSDWEEEEEEWEGYRQANGDNGFATGVTFDELSTVGAVLQQDMPEPSLQKKAVDIVQRIHGTELFSLLENSMEGASRRIAALLDKSLSAGTDFSSSYLRKNDVEGFDIGEFV